jgi:heme-degrading monooxygenase HmoA
MEFKEEHISDFEELFQARKGKIRNHTGCESLSLLRDMNNPCVFLTYSYWTDVQDLERYRNSDLFMNTWKEIKPWFNSAPQAWSVSEEVTL